MVCFGLFVMLLIGVVRGWGPLASFDDRGDPAADWAVGNAVLTQVLRIVEVAFGTVSMTVLTVVVAAGLWLKGHRRAAAYAVSVMVVTSLVTTLVKVAVGRDRPEWQLREAVLSSKAYPSGHASGIAAFGAVLIVVVILLVRRRQARRAAYVSIAVAVVVVCLDRVLLGRHFPSDVFGGVLLGVGVALTLDAVLRP